MEVNKVKRRCRQKTIDTDGISVKFGTTNINEPKTIYIEFNGFVTPQEGKKEYDADVRLVKKKYSKLLDRFIENTHIFSDKNFTIFSIAENFMAVGKKSYYTIQTTLRQNGEEVFSFDDVEIKITPYLIDMAYGIKDAFDSVDLLPTKKKND